MKIKGKDVDRKIKKDKSKERMLYRKHKSAKLISVAPNKKFTGRNDLSKKVNCFFIQAIELFK